MKKIILIAILYSLNSFSLKAQDAYLSFIDEDKKEFFRNNGWELYYSNDDIKFFDYIIHKENLVIASTKEYDYNIHFLNKERLIEKTKNISGNENMPLTPKLYLDEENVVFAPIPKFECRIIPEKERIKKKSRWKNFRKRSNGEFFQKYWHYGFYTIYSFASLDKENGFQKVEIQLGLDEKNLSTLYTTKVKSDYLTYSYKAERVELEIFEDKIILVDNFKSKFSVFDFSGHQLAEKDLSDFSKNKSTHFGGALLRRDPVNNKMYLVFRNNLYQIKSVEKNFHFEKIDLKGDFRFSKSRVYDNYIYNLFSLGERKGRAIYRKRLK
ncbi:hypothetical protein [Marivirga sp.]|uniref:hypothetical protein n=1 Tax=Marivirga sp. TaxID=2018662 RepID=UPI003DA6EEBD